MSFHNSCKNLINSEELYFQYYILLRLANGGKKTGVVGVVGVGVGRKRGALAS